MTQPSSRPVASAGDVAPGKTLRVVAGSDAVLLCNVDGTFYAVEDLCTHDGGELDQGELDGCRIECPRHGALFDVRTGAVLSLPAIVPIRTFAVRREGDALYIDG